jgi:hypothetical protein
VINPIPAKETLAPDEVAIRIHSEAFDDFGRVQFTAFWLDDYLPPNGVRGQVFHTNLADFVRRNVAGDRKVTALDEHALTLLDDLELQP